MVTNEDVINKLKYIGLDLEKIPEKILKFEPLEYKPSKYSDEHLYKVYKYININDIQIMLTKANRLSSIKEKYGKAVPLFEFLDLSKEENIEKNTKFLSMISKMDKDRIKEIEKEQKNLNSKIPFKVKYQKDYLWQIYYSEYTNKYFMLVPTEDLEQSAFFYLLKKQLEHKKQETVFVPISYVDYSGEYLSTSQIADIENYLWLFTKQWPLVYEVYDKQGNLSIQITGKTYIYDDIQSDYKINLRTKEECIKLYKLLKALFIMQTELPHHYNFRPYINEYGALEFNFNNKKIIYEILASFIKEEYLKAEEKKIQTTEEKIKLEKELDSKQKKSNKLEEAYLEKEKQISTFLECKKTIFGRVRYFFKYKKISLLKQEEKEEKKQEIKVIRLNKYSEVKSNYTLEELIELYKQYDKEDIRTKNLKSDVKGINQRIENLKSKVRNAELYIEEIDKHKKSIFEFWKFTNKDKQEVLPVGEVNQENKKTLQKVFNYELDFEDLANNLDKTQRELLTKEEIDSIFLATTNILEDINKVEQNKKITLKRLETLKKEVAQENSSFEKESFDIFGGISYDNKLKMLANQKHREVEKDIFRILNINKNTTVEEYTEVIKEVIKKLNSAFEKIEIPISIPVYGVCRNEITEQTFNEFYIRGTDAINLDTKKIEEINLCKVNITESTPVIAFTNIAYYENTNKTLPLGMNVKESILLNNKIIKAELKSENKINMLYYKEPENELSDTIVKEIKIKEYGINK